MQRRLSVGRDAPFSAEDGKEEEWKTSSVRLREGKRRRREVSRAHLSPLSLPTSVTADYLDVNQTTLVRSLSLIQSDPWLKPLVDLQ